MPPPRCAEAPKHVTFKVGPPKGDPDAGFGRMNTHALRSLETSERDFKEREATKKSKRHGSNLSGTLVPLNDNDFEASYSVKLQLQIWQDALKEELKFYRSVVIASEVLLQRVAACVAGERLPSLLATATCLTIWGYFLPLLGPFQELARGLLDEVTHAIYISPAKSFSLETSAAAYARKTFFDSFFSLAESYYFHRQRSNKFKRMADHEGRVLDRAVDHWQRSLTKKLLQGWRGYTRRAEIIRQKYRRVFRKANAGLVAGRAIRLWRRHAHVLQLEKLASANTVQAEQLRTAHQLQRQAQERLKLVQEESKRKERMLVDSTAQRNRISETHTDLSLQQRDVTARYLMLRSHWIEAVVELFNDVHKVPYGVDYANWIHQMLPTSASQSAEVGEDINRGKTVKITPHILRQVVEALQVTQKVTSKRENDLRAMASHAENNLQDAERTVQLFASMTGVHPPLSAPDIVRGDVLRLKYFVLLLMELYAGGQTCCFFPNHSESLSNADLLSESVLLATSETNNNNNASGEANIGSRIASRRGSVEEPTSPLMTAGSVALVKGSHSFLTLHANEFKPKFQKERVTETTLRTAMRAKRRSTMGGIATGASRAAGDSGNSGNEGAQMTYDWNDGLELLRSNGCCTNRPAETLGELSQFGEQMKLQREAQKFFDFASTLGSSSGIPREIIEDALKKFLPEEDVDIAGYAWPPTGMSTLPEFVQYATEIAALAAKTPTEVIHLIETNVEVSEAMSFIIATKGDDVQLVVASFYEEINRAFEQYAASKAGSSTSPAKTKSKEKKGKSEKLVFTVESFLQFAADYGVQTDPVALVTLIDTLATLVADLDDSAFVIMLCAIAVHADPSPFVSLHAKLKILLREIFHR